MKLCSMPCRATQEFMTKEFMGHGGEFWQNVVHWRREWQTTSAFFPWESHEQSVSMKLLSHVPLFVIPWTIAYQTPPSRNFPGKSTGMDCHFLLQGIFLTWGLSPGLPHCRQMLYHLSYQGSPLMNSMKRQKDRTLKDELLRSVGTQYAIGDQWRNNSRRKEKTEPKQKQQPVMVVTGVGSEVQCWEELYCIGTWNVRSMNQGKLEAVKRRCH